MPRQALLFVDQVESTRLLAEIGDEAMVDVRRRLRRLLADAVEANGGRVFGDMGDGVAASFASPSQAARAALNMQSEADATRSSVDPVIELRVGVHDGEVVPNDDGFIGMSVHIAARLCDAAPNGHIAASEEFCHALGAVDGISVTPFERRVMKGIAEPLAVNLITDAARSRPLPAVRSERGRWRVPSTPWLAEQRAPQLLVGRAKEETALERIAERSDGRTQLALIEGEPGIGKSTLLHSCGARFVSEGRLCLIGRADETQPVPYREFIEAIAHVVPHLPDTVVAEHVLRHGHLLPRLIPGFGLSGDALEGGHNGEEADRFRLFEAVVDLLRAVTAQQPVVLLLEDLHWSAQPSLALLRHLVRSVQLPSLFILASLRTTEVRSNGSDQEADLADFLGRVATHSNVTRIPLGPLVPADVAAMVSGSRFSNLATQLHEKTAGNPLFVTEMVRSFGEATEPPKAPDGSLLVPDTVQELAADRVDRLGPSHRAVLADAAVLGPVFDLTDLEGLTSDHIDVLATLEASDQAGIVSPHAVDDEAFVFNHALVREALYERISAPRRRRRHRAAADVLLASKGSRADERAAAILRHIELSGAEWPPELIADLARSAASAAISRLDLAEAVRQRVVVVEALRLRLASVGAGDDEGTVELIEALLALGASETSVGRPEGHATFVEAAGIARSLGRWDLFSEAASGYGGLLKENQATLDVSEPAALLSEALEHEPDGTAMRARLLTSLAIWQRQHVPYADRRALTDTALEIARSLDDKRTLATVLAEVHRALHGPNTTFEALEASQELEQLAAELGDDTIALQALNLRLLSEFELGGWDNLNERAEYLDQVAGRIGTIEGHRIGLLWRATVAAMQGDEPKHLQTARELSRLIAAFPSSARVIMLGASGMVLPWFRGESDVMYTLAKDFAPPYVQAMFAADSGQLDLALDHLNEGGGPERLVDDQNYLFFQDAVGMTRTVRRSGDAKLASRLFDLLHPMSGRNARMGLVAFLGAVDHHLGSLAVVQGNTDAAVYHFSRALDQHRRMNARPWIALTAAELAVALHASGRGGDEVLAAEATEIAQGLGLALVMETLSDRDVR